MDSESAKTDIAVIGVLALVTICAVLIGNAQDWQSWFPVYWRYSPNAYRLWEQFTLYLSGVLSSNIVNIMALTFFGFMVLTYLTIRPMNDMPLFMMWMLYMAFWGYVMNGPMYLLLCALARYYTRRWAPALLIPLVLIKEVSVWLGLGYLVLHHRWKSGTIFFVLSVIVYGFLRFVVIGNVPDYSQVDPSSAPLFTPIWMFTMLLSSWSVIVVILLLLPVIVLVVLSAWRSPDWRLWAWMTGPNVLFALFYEPQLWLPIVMMQQPLVQSPKTRISENVKQGPARGAH
ncbi:MAG: hypothetical protein C4K49_05315 [Candidatus Thorarchaeota archaeon]|nr:MAG: hypothetical protein C4K49_05315 [Candidatus Thorarchaeota archaeon]